jgi:hypothetical protein
MELLGGANAIGSTNDPAWNGEDDHASVISLLKALVINTTPTPEAE